MNAKLRSFRFLTIGCCLMLSMIVGCGSKKVNVTGKVTMAGKPVVWGSVIFVDETGTYHQGTIDNTGVYKIPDVPPGKVKVAVTSPNPENNRKGANAGGGAAAASKAGLEDPREKFLASQGGRKEGPTPPPAGAWFALPTSAADPETSKIEAVVVSADKPIDIDVK